MNQKKAKRLRKHLREEFGDKAVTPSNFRKFKKIVKNQHIKNVYKAKAIF